MSRASSSVVRRLLESALVVAACAGCASTVEPVDSGAASGEHEVPSAPAGCDTALEPRDAPACVADGFGVFVDAARGSDQGPGTRASPLKTSLRPLPSVTRDARVRLRRQLPRGRAP